MRNYIVTVYEPKVDPGGNILDLEVKAINETEARLQALDLASKKYPNCYFEVYACELAKYIDPWSLTL